MLRAPVLEVITKDEKDKHSVSLGVSNIPTSFANGIRREIISGVRTVAMVAEPPEKSTIRFHENTSRFNNQFLALRMSLLPVHIPPPIPGHGTDAIITERYEIRLDVDATDGDRIVTTKDLQVFDMKTSSILSPEKTHKVFPYEPITILHLRGPRGDTPAEKVRVSAGLAIGSGKEHACFSPTCCAIYNMAIDESEVNTALEIAVDEEGIRGTSREAGFREAFRKTTGLRYVKRDSNGDPVGFKFQIESIGQFPPEQIFGMGIKCLHRRCSDLLTELNTLYSKRDALNSTKKTLRSSRLELVVEGIRDDGTFGDEYMIKFKNEDHTMGGLLQDIILRKAKNDEPDMYSSWFVGYRIPHPLTPEMVMRFHRKDLTIDVLFEGFIIPSVETIMYMCENLIGQVNSTIEHVEHPSARLLGEPDTTIHRSDEGASAASAAAAGAASATSSS